MKVKAWILDRVARHGRVASADVVGRFGISRQTAAQHLRELVQQRRLTRIGATRGATYVRYRPSPTPEFKRRFALKGLQEDRIYRLVEGSLDLRRRLSRQALSIAYCSFSEMLNNAIEHSRSAFATVHATCDDRSFLFSVQDKGVGVFASVRRKFGLADDFDAAEHLLKGKQTTDPERHTGQGIFFTSKIADRFSLESARLILRLDNDLQDVFFQDRPPLKGTRVTFEIRRRTRKVLQDLFDQYTNVAFEFDRTRVAVRLSQRPGEHVSRSAARRLLAGLEKFRRVVLDFRKVTEVGQGFADEVFRVFHTAHPDISIEAVGMAPAVEAVVRRAAPLP